MMTTTERAPAFVVLMGYADAFRDAVADEITEAVPLTAEASECLQRLEHSIEAVSIANWALGLR